jgi:tetratricopeptide (TPR) repeat protein
MSVILTEPGDLAETPLAAILLEALNVRASGVLEVAHGGGTSRLWFRDGRPVGAQVFAGFRPLGMMLLQAGLIDIDALSRSLALMAETRRPQGELLVEMGAASAVDVGRVLAEQQASYFGLIAALESGSFVFDGSTPVPEWTRGARLSPVRTIVEALERPQAGALVASALRQVAANGVRLSSGYPEVAEGFRWTDVERALVARLERPITLEVFFAASPVPPERAQAILAALLLLGVAREAGAAGDEATMGIALSAEELTASYVFGKEGAPTATPTPPATAIPTSTAIPISAATPASSSPAARRSDPAEARARRQRLLQQAMRNMGVGPFAGRPADGGRASPPLETTPAPAPPAPRPGAPASGPEAQLREALLAAAPRAKERDLFVRLGVAESAGREDAKKAFLALAKQFHPDRFASPALADLQDVVRDFFSAVNEAYEVLSDDRKRIEYLKKRQSGDAARAEAANVDFQKGEACLRTRDFGRARSFLESAVRADPRPAYQAALAWAYVCDPASKERERPKALVAEATRDPSCDRAFYVAGIIARDEGDAGLAERHFRAAIQANPRSADAVRELRLLEARRADQRR